MQPLVASDLYKFVLAADPQIAPDGATVIYRRSVFDPEGDCTRGSLWRLQTDSLAMRFTSGPDDRIPRFTFDGTRVAFVRIIDETARIFVMPVDGGEAQPVSEECKAIASLAWSPDGHQIAYTATAAFEPRTAHIYLDEKSGARHICALPYKSDPAGLLDGTHAQLFVLDVPTGTTRQLTSGDSDVSDPAWSPNGLTIAFTVSTTLEASMIADIAVVEVETGDVRRLTDSAGPNGAPAFSPDGRRLAWLGHQHGNDTRYGAELFVAQADGSGRRSLSGAMDRPTDDTINGDLRTASPCAARWRNEREVVSLVTDGPNVSLRAFDADSGEITLLADGEREIYAFSLAPSGHVAIAYSTPVVPSAIAVVTPGGREQCLTQLNPWLAEKWTVEPSRMAATAKDGTPLEYWLMMPPTTIQSPSPVVLEIHGGPHATYGNSFFLEFQILAGCGIAVAYGNPRGSAGYGQAFANAITGHWGGVDASDLHAILDAALAAASLDPERVAVVGGSYGGMMTTWLLGHSNRFATGISMRACNDFVSFTGASDIGYFFKAELGLGVDRDAMHSLFEQSPIRAAECIEVPMLIMHSENDYRCPVDQGEQLFNILRMLGKKDVEFVRFTGDGHGLSRGGKPRHRMLRLRAIAHWLLRYIGRLPYGGEAPAGSLFRPVQNEPEYEPSRIEP